MTSPLDTTLHGRAETVTPVTRRLIAVCSAGRPVLPPRGFALSDGTIELGRAVGPEALGLAEDPRVSRRHAALDVRRGEALLRSLGPVTELNGARVEAAPLADGDVISLGESALVFRESTAGREAHAVAGVVGESPAMRAVRRSIAKVGREAVSVLVLGETGTGKELIARALHEASGREGAFVAVNCAAIAASLAESQLFGHVAGAFTGAVKAGAGVFRAAHGGTLLLDELGDLPLELQPKLLRALEERAIAPVGAVEPVPVDVRVLAATHRDLLSDVAAGRFRGDLYARLAEFTIELPPLRDRREDVFPILAHHFDGPWPELPFALTRALLLHPWPFNAREARMVATQIRLAMDGEGLDALVDRLRDAARATHAAPPRPPEQPPPARPERPRAPMPSKTDLVALLRAHRGNVTEIARATGRSRKQVYRWIEAHRVDPTTFRET